MNIRYYIKPISFVLTFIILFQSCTVYHSTPATREQALKSNDKVKIKSTDSEVYKFLEISEQDDELYGMTTKNSYTAKMLSDQIDIDNSDKKHVKILLIKENIASFHLKNKTGSTIATVAIPVVLAGALVGIGYAAVDNMSLDLDWSD